MKFRNLVIMMVILMMAILSCACTSNSESVVETQSDNAITTEVETSMERTTEATTEEAETTTTETDSINNGIVESVESTIIDEKVLEKESETSMQKLKLFVDDVEVDVNWEDNASVNQIKELVKDSPIAITAHQYGGLEQVGEIGHNIVSNNVQMTTEAGDIVLYAGNSIVIFYGSNSWLYTKLGKINKTNNELKDMLNKNGVVFIISY